MYDEIINGIAYSISFDSGYLSDLIFDFCQTYSFDFFAFLGVMIGSKFLKDAFNFSN